MGGRAAERLIFGGIVSTGAADDLQRATEIATEMATRYGMIDAVGEQVYTAKRSAFLSLPADTSDAAKATRREIDIAVRAAVEAGAACAGEILSEHRAVLGAGVELLLDQETLTADEFPVLKRAAHPTPSDAVIA